MVVPTVARLGISNFLFFVSRFQNCRSDHLLMTLAATMDDAWLDDFNDNCND